MARANDLSVTVRSSSPRDHDAVLALVPRLVEFGPPPWRDPEAMTATDTKVVADALGSADGNAIVLVAVSDADILLGFVHLRSLVDYYTQLEHGHVADIVVAPGYEGQGIATMLLEAGERWARDRGYEWLSISVFESNSRAASLYERSGFGRDIVRMVKPLR